MSAERRPRRAHGGLALLVVGLASCGGSGVEAPRPAAAPAAPPAPSVEQPLGLPTGLGPGDAPTQRTFTFRYDGPGGDGVLSLTLRLQAADRFLLSGRDRILRRQVWALHVADGRGLLLDPRAETYCWYGGEVELDAVPLGPLPLETLPALLLGRVPIPPASDTRVGEDERIEFHDERGREWRVRTLQGEVETWTLYADGEPEVWYSTRGAMRYLSARREELQLRWRENLAEPLAGALAPPAPPADYRLACP